METPPRGRITEIPLFPLDLVLFPNIILPLHIFEPRYKTMVRHCLDHQQDFGIVLMTGIDERTGLVKTAPVGCSARITETEPLDEGRLNIQVLGIERFRILDTHDAQPYLTGVVEWVEDDPIQAADWQPLIDALHASLVEYLTLQMARIGRRNVRFELPDDPAHLSFIAAGVLPIANTDKQLFLDLTDTPDRLLRTQDVLRRAVQKLGELEQESAPTAVVWQPLRDDRFVTCRCPN